MAPAAGDRPAARCHRPEGRPRGEPQRVAGWRAWSRAAKGVELTWGGEQAVAVGDVAGEPDSLVALNSAFMAVRSLCVWPGAPLSSGRSSWSTGSTSPTAPSFPAPSSRSGEDAQASVVEIVASADVACAGRPGHRARRGRRRPAGLSQRAGARAAGLADRVAGQPGRPGRRRSPRQSVAFGGDYARVRTDSALAGQGASTRLLAVYFGDGDQMHDFRTVQDHAGPKTHVRPAVQGRGGRHVPLRLHRSDPGRKGRGRAPTPSRPTATWCSTRGPTPTRSPTWRSRRTTFAAATPRPSARSTRSSASTSRAAVCPPRWPTG